MEQLSSIYERWIETPRWQKWIFILLLGIMLFLVLYYYKIQPLNQELERKRSKVESLSLVVSKLKVFKKQRDKVQNEIAQLEKQISAIEKKLPTGNEEVSQILRAITDADSGMVIRFIKRGHPQSNKYYVSYPYTVQLVGTYPKFIRWCERLAKADRIINFGDLAIVHYETSANSKEVGKKYTIVATLDIKAFTLKKRLQHLKGERRTNREK